MSDFVWPHRQQPTRLPRPWDSPGKNTGVGCHFLLSCMKVKSESEVAQSCPTLCDPMDCSLPGSSIHGIFPGKSTGVCCHCLLEAQPKKKKKKFFFFFCLRSTKSSYFPNFRWKKIIWCHGLFLKMNFFSLMSIKCKFRMRVIIVVIMCSTQIWEFLCHILRSLL